MLHDSKCRPKTWASSVALALDNYTPVWACSIAHILHVYDKLTKHFKNTFTDMSAD